MATSKWPRPDENTNITFIDQSTPAPKHPRLKARPITLAEIKNLQQARAQKDQAATEANERTESKYRIERVLGCITEAGYETLYCTILLTSYSMFVINSIHLGSPKCSASMGKLF